jgi:hypothetical protein
MYIVTIHNGNTQIPIHDTKQKLSSGKITKGINTIDSFQFSISPANAGFNEIFDYTTLVTVYNTNRDRNEFYGRVLYSEDTMSEDGEIKKEVICESYFGFLCDSQQEYVEEKNWSVGGLIEHIVNTHNRQMESYKQFVIGEVNVTDPNDIVYCGIQRKNTWDTIKEKLLDELGGEIRFRVEGNTIYLDYLTEIGQTSETEIALSKNMKAISREKDPSQIVTRLIPLGYKLSTIDDEGNKEETEYRLDITSVNNGKNYIDDELAISIYGIRVGVVEFDDVTVASTLLKKGEDWLIENNKIQVSYTITALDLSLLGLDADDFEVCNYHRVRNSLFGIDDDVRIIKKTIDICEEIKSTLEFGDNFETLSESMKRQSDALGLITANFVTNKRFENVIEKTSTLIEQTEEQIRLEVKGYYNDLSEEVMAELALKVGKDENDQVISMINASANVINLTADRLNVRSAEQWFGKRVFELSGGKIRMSVTGDMGDTDFVEIYDGGINMRNEGIDGELIEKTAYYSDGMTRCVNPDWCTNDCITLMTVYKDGDPFDGWIKVKINTETLEIFATRGDNDDPSATPRFYVWENLVGCASSGGGGDIWQGDSYTTIINPIYTVPPLRYWNLTSIEVRMGGEDITESVVTYPSNALCKIDIPEVTDDVYINATAEFVLPPS